MLRSEGRGVNCFTPYPNYLFDEVLAVVSPAEWKVVSFLVRKTFGWQKRSDTVSAGQIVVGTGLARSTVKTSLARLKLKGIIFQGKTAAGRPNEVGLVGRLSAPTQADYRPTTSPIIGPTKESKEKRNRPSGGREILPAGRRPAYGSSSSNFSIIQQEARKAEFAS